MTKKVEFATFTQTVMIRLEPYCSTPEVHQISSKARSGINILYLLTGPMHVPPLPMPGGAQHLIMF